MYWEKRKVAQNRQRLKQSIYRYFIRSRLSFLLASIRLGSDHFLVRSLDRYTSTPKPPDETINVLDVGCGWGRILTPYNDDINFYGVDIEGYPKELALEKGYVRADTYNQDLTIPHPDSFFDYVWLVNVNAHVTDREFSHLIKEIRRVLKNNGKLFMVAELNNNGLSYKFMRLASEDKLNILIHGMTHYNFKYEDELDDFMSESGLKVLSKKAIMGHFIPFGHIASFIFNAYSYRKWRWIGLSIDVLLSIANGLSMLLTPDMQGKAFTVGYVLSNDS